ncbi:MAG: hypothetical protein WBX25_02775 [Rhodomicrobium sp.]
MLGFFQAACSSLHSKTRVFSGKKMSAVAVNARPRGRTGGDDMGQLRRSGKGRINTFPRLALACLVIISIPQMAFSQDSGESRVPFTPYRPANPKPQAQQISSKPGVQFSFDFSYYSRAVASGTCGEDCGSEIAYLKCDNLDEQHHCPRGGEHPLSLRAVSLRNPTSADGHFRDWLSITDLKTGKAYLANPRSSAEEKILAPKH